MPPPPLRFDLLPRRPRRGLKPALFGLVVAAMAAVAVWLQPRQAELADLRDAINQARVQQQAALSSASPTVPPAAWQTAAVQDGRLFALALEPRLLEIERCADARATVTRIVHDELAGIASIELVTAAADDVAELVSCLNTGDHGAHRWRLTGVEAQQSPAAGTANAPQRVVLRRD